jgi:UDP-N-acetylmuramoylalanine--D-glutamate ligase
VLQDAVIMIDNYHDRNSVALLSPAAASLDQFPSYAKRGEDFKMFVQDLS